MGPKRPARARIYVLALAALCAARASPAPDSAPLPLPTVPPNIVVIMADDLGYADLSYNGATQITTPNIDALAAQGVTFSNGYAGHAVCSSSRAALMTGRAASRMRHEGNIAFAPFDNNHGLSTEETVFAQYLRDAGYRTGMVGKWHLGAAERFTPLNRGFDYFFGFLGGSHDYFESGAGNVGLNDYVAPLIEGRRSDNLDRYLTDELTAKAVEFVKDEPGAPFFLYLAYNAPHGPMQAPERLVNNYGHVDDTERRVYLAMVDAMDRGVGRLIDALDDAGLRDNTLVFFLNDNGGPDRADNGQFRGGKGSLHEGGLRVPFIASWPARWPQSSTYTPMVSSTDIAATALAMSGIEASSHRKPLDGVNLDPFARGEQTGAPHEALFWRQSLRGGFAVRSGDLKLIRTSRNAAPRLYNLASDPGEKTDVLAGNEVQANRLAGLWNGWNEANPPGNAFIGRDYYNRKLREHIDDTATAALNAAKGQHFSIPTFSDGAETSSNGPSLQALSLSGIDFGGFSPGTLRYDAAVAHTVTATTVTVTPADPEDTVAIADAQGRTQGATRTVELAEGPNTVVITVSANDSDAATTYRVQVTRSAARLPSNDATLASLTLSGVDIGTFSAAQPNYTATVQHAVSGTTVRAAADHAGASVSISDARGRTAGPFRHVSLSEGENAIAVTVTAQDGVTTSIYTATVTRSKPPLTAALENVPQRHTGPPQGPGPRSFAFEVRFSESVRNNLAGMRATFDVTGGVVSNAKRLGSSSHWEIKVAPAGDGDVTIALEANRPCGQTGAICTSDLRMLSTPLSATVAGPASTQPQATIAAGTASVTEGAAASFTVTLDEAASSVVTVSVSVTETGSVISGTKPTSVTIAQGGTVRVTGIGPAKFFDDELQAASWRHSAKAAARCCLYVAARIMLRRAGIAALDMKILVLSAT